MHKPKRTTDQRSALIAAAGLLNVLVHRLGGYMLFGLPVWVMDAALICEYPGFIPAMRDKTFPELELGRVGGAVHMRHVF